MGTKAVQLMPRARREGLIVEELDGKVLVYDLDTNKAHCLNGTSALVWECCDGRTSVAEAAHRVSLETEAPPDEAVVWLALRQLSRYGLLQRGGAIPAPEAGVSRRELIRKYLPLALARPAVVSVAAPTAAQVASTCVGLSCSSNFDCCSGFGCAIPPDAVPRGVRGGCTGMKYAQCAVAHC